MGLFKKHTAGKRKGDLLAEKMASGILSRQRKWADYLNAKIAGASFKSKLLALVIFSIGTASYLIYLLLSSIF